MTSDIKFTIKFRVPTHIIYQSLTDSSLMINYMQCKLIYENKINTEYSLYDNAITGKIVELVENKKIVQTWKFNSWPNEAELKLTFLEKKGNESQINILLKNVPNRDIFGKTIEEITIVTGFHQMIFDKISTWLGYPQNKDESEDDDE